MIKQFAIAASLALLSTAAMAADEPYFYAGVDAGTTELDEYSDDREASYGAFFGYQFNRNFAIEAGARSLADFDDANARQVSASVIGSIPFGNRVSGYARLGFNHISTKNLTVVDKESDSHVLVGLGVAVAFTPVISGRFEVQKPNGDSTSYTLGVGFRF